MRITTQRPISAIGGLENPEDFCVIPGTGWVMTSAMSGRGIDQAHSSFIHIETHEVLPAYPNTCTFEPDYDAFSETEPPVHFMFHGLDVGTDERGRTVLYQVNHPLDSGPNEGAGRESVEVFLVDLVDGAPSLRWIGAVRSPNYVWGNEVCALPTGGFALTNFVTGSHENFDAVASGEICGQVLEWENRDRGWRVVEGTDVNAPNGIALSRDGRHYFVASWATMQLHKISRSEPHRDRATVDLGALLDNITWTPQGTLLVAGQVSDARTLMQQFAEGNPAMIAPIRAIEVDPETLDARVLVDADPGDRLATTVLQVDHKQVWAGSSACREILVYQPPTSNPRMNADR